jgi:hypothetical protein
MKNPDKGSGDGKIKIRNKHLGSATLLVTESVVIYGILFSAFPPFPRSLSST